MPSIAAIIPPATINAAAFMLPTCDTDCTAAPGTPVWTTIMLAKRHGFPKKNDIFCVYAKITFPSHSVYGVGFVNRLFTCALFLSQLFPVYQPLAARYQ